jgi:predicted nucleic acid-binding protein
MLVCDASTLILIARIELLDPFLAGVSLEVAIPQEVERECCDVKATLDALMIRKAVNDSRIRVMRVKDKRLVAKLQDDFSLGKGEAEAIALGITEKAQLVATDDKNGINACKLLLLSFTTAAGILIRSLEKNLISRSDALARLDRLAHYGRYKSSIIQDVRARLEGSK